MTTTFEPVELPSRYAKAIVAILTAAVGVLVTGLADSVLSAAELGGVGVAVLTAVGVYLVPNLPAGVGRYAKLAVAIVGTALQAAVPLLTEGSITSTGWLLILLAALGAVGVNIVPNTGEPITTVMGEERFPEDEVDVALTDTEE